MGVENPEDIETAVQDYLARLGKGADVQETAREFVDHFASSPQFLRTTIRAAVYRINHRAIVDDSTAHKLATFLVGVWNSVQAIAEQGRLGTNSVSISGEEVSAIAGEAFAVKQPLVSSRLLNTITNSLDNPCKGLIEVLRFSPLVLTQVNAIGALLKMRDAGYPLDGAEILPLLDIVKSDALPALLPLAAMLAGRHLVPLLKNYYDRNSSNERIVCSIVDSLTLADSQPALHLFLRVARENRGYVREMSLSGLGKGLLKNNGTLLETLQIDDELDCIFFLYMFLWVTDADERIDDFDGLIELAWSVVSAKFPSFMQSVDQLQALSMSVGRTMLLFLADLAAGPSSEFEKVRAVRSLVTCFPDLANSHFFGERMAVKEALMAAQSFPANERVKALVALAVCYSNPDDRQLVVEEIVEVTRTDDIVLVLSGELGLGWVLAHIRQLANELGGSDEGDALRDFLKRISGGEGASFRFIPNPYIVGRPIDDQKIFFGRQDVFDYIDTHVFGVEKNNVLVLHGERRMGKTSILKQMLRRFPDRVLSIFVDMQGVTPGINSMANEDQLFSAIMREATRQLQAQRFNTEGLFETRGNAFEWFKNEFVPRTRSRVRDRSVLFMVDEFEYVLYAVESGRLPADLLPHLRHLMQHVKGLDFILAGPSDLVERLSKMEFNVALFKKVSFLDEVSARRLILEPVESYGMLFDDNVIEEIMRLSGSHPYLLQLLCHEMVVRHNKKRKNRVTVDDLTEISDGVVKEGDLHFAAVLGGITEKEKVVLSALTSNRSNRGDLDAITEDMKRRYPSIQREAIWRATESLNKKEFIRTVGQGRYELTIGLMELWLASRANDGL